MTDKWKGPLEPAPNTKAYIEYIKRFKTMQTLQKICPDCGWGKGAPEASCSRCEEKDKEYVFVFRSKKYNFTPLDI